MPNLNIVSIIVIHSAMGIVMQILHIATTTLHIFDIYCIRVVHFVNLEIQGHVSQRYNRRCQRKGPKNPCQIWASHCLTPLSQFGCHSTGFRASGTFPHLTPHPKKNQEIIMNSMKLVILLHSSLV